MYEITEAPDDPYDPANNTAESYDDRNDGSVDMDDLDAFNRPEDRVAHL